MTRPEFILEKLILVLREWICRLWGTIRRNPRDDDLEDELRLHLELATENAQKHGGTPEDALRAARLQAGRIAQAMEVMRDQRGLPWVDDLARDVRHSLNFLRRSPGFTTVALLIIAFGIGANVAVFSVVKSVLLDALPYADADRLVRVYGRLPDGSLEALSAGTINDISGRQQSFERLAAFHSLPIDVVYASAVGARIVKSGWVEAGFFEPLGVVAARGRTFGPDDGAIGFVPISRDGLAFLDTAPVVVLTHGAWLRLFAGDPGVIGRDVRINGNPRKVIGVLPADFIGPIGEVDFYFVLDLNRDPVRANPIAIRQERWLGLVGRLKPDVSHASVQRE